MKAIITTILTTILATVALTGCEGQSDVDSAETNITNSDVDYQNQQITYNYYYTNTTPEKINTEMDENQK